MKELLFYPAYQREGLKVCRAVRRVFGLAFLPVDRVASTLDEIEVDFNQLDPNLWVNGVKRPDLTTFFTYVRSSYVAPGTVAQIAMWNVFYTDHHRTNNNLEGYHQGLKYKIRESHPGLWKLIGHLIYAGPTRLWYSC
jgi:hypothetical protein